MIKTLFLLSIVALISCHEFSPDSKVVFLNEENFDQNTLLFNETSKPTQSWFIMFYAPWCGHCKRLIPTWEQLAETTNLDNVKVAAVNCDESSGLRNRFQIRGYPSLMFFSQEGQMYKYAQERSIDSLKSYISGGYKNTEPHQMPGEYKPSVMDKIFNVSNLPVIIGVALVLILLCVFICNIGGNDDKPKEELNQEASRSKSPDQTRSDKKRD